MLITSNGGAVDAYEADVLADYALHVDGALIDQLDMMPGEKVVTISLDGRKYDLPKTSAYVKYAAVVERQNRYRDTALAGLNSGASLPDRPEDWKESWEERRKWHDRVIGQWTEYFGDVECGLKEQFVRDLVVLAGLLSP